MALLAPTAIPPAASSLRRYVAPGWLALLLLTFPLLVAAEPEATPEYQVKAVFLFNFAQFVEWPGAGFPAQDAPLAIGVLGTDPFGTALDDVVRGETVGAHKLTVQRFTRVEDVGACQILFISASETSRLDQVLDQLQGRPILTVSDFEGSARRGVMIRFRPDKGRIRLRINLAMSQRAGLQISSKLLRRAEIVGQEESP